MDVNAGRSRTCLTPRFQRTATRDKEVVTDKKVVTDKEVGDSDKEESAGDRAMRTDEAGTDARP